MKTAVAGRNRRGAFQLKATIRADERKQEIIKLRDRKWYLMAGLLGVFFLKVRGNIAKHNAWTHI